MFVRAISQQKHSSRSSEERVLWKYAANLLENTHAEVGNGMGVLL